MEAIRGKWRRFDALNKEDGMEIILSPNSKHKGKCNIFTAYHNYTIFIEHHKEVIRISAIFTMFCQSII